MLVCNKIKCLYLQIKQKCVLYLLEGNKCVVIKRNNVYILHGMNCFSIEQNEMCWYTTEFYKW